MTIEINKTPEAILVALKGSLDTLAAEQVDRQVSELETNIDTTVVLECKDLEYIASSGLRLFLRIRKAANAKGQKVMLKNINANIMEVLQVTHFDKMFVIQ